MDSPIQVIYHTQGMSATPPMASQNSSLSTQVKGTRSVWSKCSSFGGTILMRRPETDYTGSSLHLSRLQEHKPLRRVAVRV
jgi:hypothetical protein